MKTILPFLLILTGCASVSGTRAAWGNVEKQLMVPNPSITDADIKANGYRAPSSAELESFKRLEARCNEKSIYTYRGRNTGLIMSGTNYEIKNSCMRAEGWQYGKIE